MRRLFVPLLLCGCASTPARVDVGGYRLSAELERGRSPTVVFESGGGGDTSLWTEVEDEIRRRTGVATVRYYRAGMGPSDGAPGPYRIDDEVAALGRLLDRLEVRGDLVLVAHSYGGFIAALFARRDPRVRGVVLVDSNLVEFYDDAQVARLMAQAEPELPAMRRERPGTARMLAGFPATIRRMREVSFPPGLRIISIATRGPYDSPDEARKWSAAHRAFAAGSPSRELLHAASSSHVVMRDRPDLIVDAVSRLVGELRGR